jgi:[acyl-carrier-protein] S-malonyltransferase
MAVLYAIASSGQAQRQRGEGERGASPRSVAAHDADTSRQFLWELPVGLEGDRGVAWLSRLALASSLTAKAALVSKRTRWCNLVRPMSVAFVFPGQGSQAVGMGADLARAFGAARTVFDEVDAALGQKLSEVMFNGPLETLTLTENAQPALMAVSLAVMRVLEQEKGFRLPVTVRYVAGHSLGEYSALAAAGALKVADAARLLRLRGQAMQAAVPVGQGAMAALLGVGKEAGEKLAAQAAQGEVCQLANDNEPTQAVISGARSAVERAAQLAKAHGVRRFIPLNVSAPFHCALMQPAADAMAQALAEVEIKAPLVPLVANVLAAPIRDPAEIRQCLVEQVTGTVRWRECVVRMAADGVSHIYEIGSGKVLAGLAKRIVPSLSASAVGTPQDIDAVLPALTQGLAQ